MPDREKVIRGLEECLSSSCMAFKPGIYCPLSNEAWDNIRDALALLKAQEPRVMKLGEVRNWVNSDRVTREPVVIEMRGGVCAWIIDDEVREIPGEADLTTDLYGKTWRCWTSPPTAAEREATPWN